MQAKPKYIVSGFYRNQKVWSKCGSKVGVVVDVNSDQGVCVHWSCHEVPYWCIPSALATWKPEGAEP